MERSVEILAIILFGVLGLSHLLQPRAWAEFFILLRNKGESGAFVDGFLNLPLAAIIVGFHNTWSGIPSDPGSSRWPVPALWRSPASLATASTPASPSLLTIGSGG